MADDVKIRWVVVNPFQHEVILREDTFDSHIVGDHGSMDASCRIDVEKQVRQVIENPRYIHQDKNHCSRYIYRDIIQITTNESIIKLKGLVTIVETNKTPHEVVTWVVQNSVKAEIPKKGMVYDAHTGILEKS